VREAGLSGDNRLVKYDVIDHQSTKVIASLCRQHSLLQLVHVDRVDCLQAWSQLKSVGIFVCVCVCVCVFVENNNNEKICIAQT